MVPSPMQRIAICVQVYSKAVARFFALTFQPEVRLCYRYLWGSAQTDSLDI